VFDLAVARTGLRDPDARQAGFDPVTIASVQFDHKAYYPGAHQLHLRLTGDRHTGRLLGAQLVGHKDAEVAKRIDIPAGALFHGMTVEGLGDLDLSYTPPFGSPWDAIQLAAVVASDGPGWELERGTGVGSVDRHPGAATSRGPSGHAGQAVLGCLLDENVEQSLLGRVRGRGDLRVPLDPDHPAGRQLDRLDRVVLRPGGGGQPRAEPVDRLVVPGDYVHRLDTAGDRQAGARLHPDPVEDRRAGVWVAVRVRLDAGQVGQVLVQGATEGNVERLGSAADAQQRQVTAPAGADQGDLQLVAGRLHVEAGRVRLGTIAGRL
jgi:hypothetical protein